MLNRRDFLNYLSTLGVIASFPSILDAKSRKSNKTLVLVELKGGNDGLNTLIPYSNPLYYEYRKKLAVQKEDMNILDDNVAFHPELKNMAKLFKNRNLACLQGVGYENPNRSHFRSIEIWESASNSEEYLENGWITDAFLKNDVQNELDGLVIGKDSLGPMFGSGLNTLVFQDPDKFLKNAKILKTLKSDRKLNNNALAHLLNIEKEVDISKELFSKRLISTAKISSKGFLKDRFSQSLYQCARVILSDLNIPVIKLSLGSFDTHTNQLKTQARLLKTFDKSINQFVNVLKKNGKFDDVLIMTYSEFGRRASENASGGTDHGKATVHLAIGGKVNGELYGQYPSLKELDNGDLKYNLDFKSVYNTLIEDWWKINSTSRLTGYKKVEGLIS